MVIGTVERLEQPEQPTAAPLDVLATIGHELRTPLSTLRATLEVLADLSSDEVEEKSRDLMPRMERTVRWLECLVNNLTTTALAQSGQLTLRRTPLAVDAALNDAIDLLAPLLDRKQQTVALRCPNPAPWIAADPVWLGQTLVNLLANASAYSPNGAEITVAAREASGCVEVRVRDQGPGIPRCEQERIFRPYARGRDGRGARADGLGLGLHIVRTLVRRHGGTVGVRSASGQGATFWFRLPSTTPPSA